MKKTSRAWALPIQDWEIVFRFKRNGKEWNNTFYNVSSLFNYFYNVPEQAMLVGHFKELPAHRWPKH
jgi:hypothetical protein